MGGRGARVKGSGKVVANNAIIPRNKLKNYLLNPTKGNGKDAVFRDLGYNMSNWRRLESDIRKELKKARDNGLLKVDKINQHGQKQYKADLTLGIGKKRGILTGWAVKDKSGVLHFITAFPNKSKGG